jgi:hypothetical protein
VPDPSLTGVHTLTLAVAFDFERERVTGSVVSEMSPMGGRFIPAVRLRSVTLQQPDGAALTLGSTVAAEAQSTEVESTTEKAEGPEGATP